MKNLNMNGLKIDNINNADAVSTPKNDVEFKGEIENTSKDASKPTCEEAPKSIKKHVIIYIGSSEYIDSTGYKWHKNDEKTYDEAEYNDRKDLHFMIKYGEMKETVVSI